LNQIKGDRGETIMKKLQVTIAASPRNPMFAKIAKEMRTMPSVKEKKASVSLRKACVALEYEGSKFYLVRDISEARKDAMATASERGFCLATALLETNNAGIKALYRDFKSDDKKFKLKFKQSEEGMVKAKLLSGAVLAISDSFTAGTSESYDEKYGQVSLISEKPAIELKINGKSVSLTWGEGLELSAELLELCQVGYYG
jgi:hypothetical protein